MKLVGQVLSLAHKLVTFPQASASLNCKVIKWGTFCRTVVWPCLPPVMTYQYIREKDFDYYCTDVLLYKSGSNDTKAFYDTSRLGISGHWRIQQDMETIRAAVNDDPGE